jgi:SAM-dependent methyltransferase
MSSHSRQQLEAWLKKIDVKGRVLDVGGSQNPIQGRTKSWEVKDYKILDLELPHETKQKPDLMKDMNEPCILIDKFNVVFCIEVMEYIWNPYQALRNFYYALEENGILYISFHTIYPVHSPENQDYLRYTRAGARKLLEEAGFEIEEITPRYFSQYQYATMLFDHEGMRGVGKNYDGIHREQGYLIKAIKL